MAERERAALTAREKAEKECVGYTISTRAAHSMWMQFPAIFAWARTYAVFCSVLECGISLRALLSVCACVCVRLYVG